MSNPTDDRILAARFVDGQMPADEQAEFVLRMQARPELRAAVSELQGLRGLFATAAAEPAPSLRPGFADRVAQRLRREAGEVTRASADVEARLVSLARWCVLAAAIVLAIALLFASGALRPADSGKLQADNGSQLIRSLDAQIRAAEAAPARR
jgi:anti-sigma-K factor RskA